MSKFWIIAIFLLGLSSSMGRSYAQSVTPDNKRQTNPQFEDDQRGEANMDGVVEVSFRIDKKGRAEILRINATSPTLADYVIKKLGKIKLEPGTTDGGKVIKYRFVFKKQA